MHSPRKLRVGISGSYGGLNLGDEAILHAMVRELRRDVPEVEITVFSRDADDTLARHPVDRAVPVRDLSRHEVLPEVARLDLFILGGGGILFDGEARIYLREVMLAEEQGIPVIVYAVSAGPLRDPVAQKAVRIALERAQVLTVRDRRAQQMLEEAGVRADVTVTADPALLLDPEPLPPDTLRMEGIDTRRRLVGISVREPGPVAPEMDARRYHALLANAADFLVDRLGAEVVFVPMERRVLDVQHSHAVISQMHHARRATVLKGKYTPGQMLELVGQFHFALGMRLHFLIFAALARVPFVALPYAPKVAGFIDELGMSMPPLEQVNAGQLIAHVDRSWDLRHEIRRRIEASLPGLRSRARETNRLAVRLLQTRRPAVSGRSSRESRP
jgi:polysaccharide pyruvyl transferase CsaB